MFEFNIWDQSNDGATMAIRAASVDVVAQLAQACPDPDVHGHWASLQDYLNHAAQATQPPSPFVRNVDALWGPTQFGVPAWSICRNRRFRVTYSGNARAGGGFAVQAYVVVDPAWNDDLQPHHQTPIQVRYLPGPDRDLIVVLP